jgi:hypothetical protein
MAIKRRCPFCQTEVEIPEELDRGIRCRCGAYGEVNLLSQASLFLTRAKQTFGADRSIPGPFVEIVDGGTVFEEKGDPAILQWARKPRVSGR